MTTTIKANLFSLQKNDILTRLRDKEKCYFDSYTTDEGGRSVLIFRGFAVDAKIMPVMFNNFEREYYVERETDQSELFKGAE